MRMKGLQRALWIVMVFILVFTSQGGFVISAEAEARTNAPGDAVVFQGRSYKIYNEGCTWTSAKSRCEALGGHLCTITGSSEQGFVTNLIKNYGEKNVYWLGAQKNQSAGTWSWVTGEKWSYTNWDTLNDQPDNSGGNESYLQIYGTPIPSYDVTAYKWNDAFDDNSLYRGTSVMGYICEWDTAKVSKPTVVTDEAEDITTNSAKVTFTVTNNGGAKITASGIQYGYSKQKIKKMSYRALGYKTGTFTLKLTGLKYNTKVYYRAYAKNSKGTVYGSWESFKTLKLRKPTVVTLEAARVSSTSAKFGIYLKKNGNAPVTDCGIQWGYSKDNLKYTLKFGKKNLNTGKFYKTLRKLKPGTTIYYQAYATNEAGSAYGFVLSFSPGE